MGNLFGKTPKAVSVAPATTDVSKDNLEADAAYTDMKKRRQKMTGFASTQLSNQSTQDTFGK